MFALLVQRLRKENSRPGQRTPSGPHLPPAFQVCVSGQSTWLFLLPQSCPGFVCLNLNLCVCVCVQGRGKAWRALVTEEFKETLSRGSLMKTDIKVMDPLTWVSHMEIIKHARKAKLKPRTIQVTLGSPGASCVSGQVIRVP